MTWRLPGKWGQETRGPALLYHLLSFFVFSPPPVLHVAAAKIGKEHLSDPYLCLSRTQSYSQRAGFSLASREESVQMPGWDFSQPAGCLFCTPTFPLPLGQQVERPRGFGRCTQRSEASAREQNGSPHIRTQEMETCSQTDWGEHEWKNQRMEERRFWIN